MQEYGDQFMICPYCGYAEGTEPKEIYFLKPGTILHNQYVIGTTVGIGGFGIVYKAWDMSLSRMIAIKEFFPMGYVNRIPGHKEIMVFGNKRQEFKKEIQRFLEEAQYLAIFSNHPNIINVYSFFEENNTAYIAMEYLDGVTYKEYIKSQGGRIEIDSTISVTTAILQALKEIHKNNIIHRDVAPDNIYICWNGRIKLMDFGAARFSKNDKELDVVLKPGFAPPEQYQAKSQQGTYTDIYAVGALMYRSLTGQMPIEASNRLERDDLLPPNVLNPEIPEKLNNIILRAMALQPDLRFQTDDEFIEVLNENYNRKIRSIKDEIKHRKRARLIKSLVAVFMLCIGIGVGIYIYDCRKSEMDLKPTILDVWIQAENNNTTSTNFMDALSEFKDKYPQIQINVTVIPKNEYGGRLREAYESNNMPDVYEVLNDFELKGKDITKLVKYVETDNYDGLDFLQGGIITKMPIVYTMPVVYVSKFLDGYSETEAKKKYDELIKDGGFKVDEDEVQRFLNGEEAYVVADTSYYWRVQENQGGKYEMKPIPMTKQCNAGYTLVLAVNDDVNRIQYNAAIQIIFFLLGEEAQSKLCIEQHQGLPLHKDIYDKFVRLNSEYESLKQEKINLIY